MNERLTKRGVIALLVIALLGAFALGVVVADDSSGSAMVGEEKEDVARQVPVVNKDRDKPDEVDFSLFWEVWDSLHAKYVDREQLDTETLVHGAIQGMVDAAGDPYTVFLPPQDAKIFKENVSGAFSGVGMEVGIRNDRLTVIAPLKGTPAEMAGLEAGDTIIAIDGASAADMSLDQAVQKIRGPQGSTVVLTIFREGEDSDRDISIVRDTIQIPVLEWSFAKDAAGNETRIAQVRLFHFTETAEGLFRDAVNQMLAQGAEGVVLDLRGNPGGFLEVAVDIASWFVDPNEIIATEWFGPSDQRHYRSNGHALLREMPTVVLVNQGSASASEIVAGALRDIRGIAVVGTSTFGKGSVQELKEFNNGSSLKVTVAKWLTPSGISIQDNGVDPDVVVEIKESQEGEEPVDAQLLRSVEMLR